MPEPTVYRDAINRAGWPSGPWDDEPDKVVWVDEATGLDCMIRRVRHGSWCGYVGVPPDHPWHGVDYDDCTDPGCGEDRHYDCTPGGRTHVHGGLTFAAPCYEEGDPATSICHVPEPGRSADVWWFGFDCAHAYDLAPAYGRGFPGDVYRDQGYVTREVERLARQLAELRHA